jgi:hypothetical protein
MRKYEIHNQITGGQEEAPTFQDALALQARIKQDYLEFNKGLFTITVLDQNGDGSWTQRLADENGEPIIPPKPPKPPIPVPTDEGTV